MLVPMSVPVTSGYSDVYVPSINAGKIQNKGFEVTLSTKNIIKNDFKWSSDAVFHIIRIMLKVMVILYHYSKWRF